MTSQIYNSVHIKGRKSTPVAWSQKKKKKFIPKKPSVQPYRRGE